MAILCSLHTFGAACDLAFENAVCILLPHISLQLRRHEDHLVGWDIVKIPRVRVEALHAVGQLGYILLIKLLFEELHHCARLIETCRPAKVEKHAPQVIGAILTILQAL